MIENIAITTAVLTGRASGCARATGTVGPSLAVNNFMRPILETTIGAKLVKTITPAKTSTKPSTMNDNSSGVMSCLIGSILAKTTVQSNSKLPNHANVLRLACLAKRFQRGALLRSKTGKIHVIIGVREKMANTPHIVQIKYENGEFSPSKSSNIPVAAIPAKATIWNISKVHGKPY